MNDGKTAARLRAQLKRILGEPLPHFSRPIVTFLGDETIEKTLHEFITRKVARHVKSDTLIIVDPSDIQKPYATQMDFLSKVWDGSKGKVGDNHGYYGCMAIACGNGGRRPMPMHLRFWSPDAPGFTSENDELESVFGTLIAATGGRGMFISDRGDDNIELYRYFQRGGRTK